MAARKAKVALQNEVLLTVGKESSILTLGKNKVEVSADGKTVIAYTNHGVEVKAEAPVAAFFTTGEKRNAASFDLAKDFNGAVLNGVRIEQAKDGHLIITAKDSKVINMPLSEGNESVENWVCIGPSAETGKPLYVAPEDAGTMSWRKAQKYAYGLRCKGQEGVRLPTERELQQMFNNKAQIPNLNTDKWHKEHWSATSSNFGTCAQSKCLKDGTGGAVGKGAYLSVRLVRS